MSFALARHQTQAWLGRSIDAAAYAAEARRLNEHTFSIFLLRIEASAVEILPKPDHLQNAMLLGRAEAYRGFLATVVAAYPLSHPFTIALEVGDQPLNSADFPFFSFQKRKGDPTLLMPDVNLLEGDFYVGESYADHVPFAEKSDKAVFVGSTSGCYNTLETLAAGLNERIEAALFFRQQQAIDFWLPNVVQSDEAATAEIRALGLGDRIVGWDEQFRYKVLLSLDGNGAACQRLAVAMKSNAAIAKYESQSILHYFHGLVPWLHYIPISANGDVLRVVATLDAHVEAIARESQRFFDAYLNRAATTLYTSMVLNDCIALNWS